MNRHQNHRHQWSMELEVEAGCELYSDDKNAGLMMMVGECGEVQHSSNDGAPGNDLDPHQPRV